MSFSIHIEYSFVILYLIVLLVLHALQKLLFSVMVVMLPFTETQ